MLFINKSQCDKIQPIIVSKENKKAHRALNVDKNFVFHYKIDGDIIPSTSTEQRCDYLLENETKKTVYLIELKGKHMNEAVDQIEATVRKFKSLLCSYAIFPRIVCGGNTHAVHSSKVVAFKRRYPNCKIDTSIIEERI